MRVSLLVRVGLVKVGPVLVAVGWQVWVSLMVSVGLFNLELGLVVVE